MQRRDFHYDLPTELIAQAPLEERRASRLLVLDGSSGEWADRSFAVLPSLIEPKDLLVFNDTKVLPARLIGRKETGGRVELLLERLIDPRTALVHLRASHTPKLGARLSFADDVGVVVVGRRDDLFQVVFEHDAVAVLEAHGQVPLPPYIARSANEADRERYQTVFARTLGAVAAPTAGLHFDGQLLAELAERGVEQAFVTLHVGAGTFAPVRSERVEDHALHAEWLEVSSETCRAIERCRARGGRVIAVGTTTVRALETAARGGHLAPFSGDSRLFIYPGYQFRVVDAMVTNFHLPESSLLMLVCAFAGIEATLAAYRHAVAARYRFFSYGDAMFLASRAGVRVGDARAV